MQFFAELILWCMKHDWHERIPPPSHHYSSLFDWLPPFCCCRNPSLCFPTKREKLDRLDSCVLWGLNSQLLEIWSLKIICILGYKVITVDCILFSLVSFVIVAVLSSGRHGLFLKSPVCSKMCFTYCSLRLDVCPSLWRMMYVKSLTWEGCFHICVQWQRIRRCNLKKEKCINVI